MARSRLNLAAMILAAGYSSRMGQFKPRLPLGDRSAIEHAIGGFRTAGIRELIVVTGHRSQELNSVLAAQDVRCIYNPNYRTGMYSSIVAGLRAFPAGIDGCFVLPADIPLVRPSTIQRLASTYRKNPSAVLYPMFASRRGHPPLIGKALFAAMMDGDGEGGLRSVLGRYEADAQDVNVLDEAIHMDMDTPAEYARLNVLSSSRDVLSPAECEEILARSGVPAKVVQHSRAVADIARKLTHALNQGGANLDTALVESGSLLHDLAKGKPNHARVGARTVERLGFPRVAEVIASHSDLGLKSTEEIDEAAIVFLADKLVQGDVVVSLRERFQRSISRYASNPAALAAVHLRWETAQCIEEAIEFRCQKSMTEILSGASDAHQQASEQLVPETAVLGRTESVCPICLQRVEAKRVRENREVYLEKTCPLHGQFRTIVWRGEPEYETWAAMGKKSSEPPVGTRESSSGCPFDCGPCAQHRQKTCCVLVEVTQRCNLACPFCFAEAPRNGADPSLEVIEGWYRALLAAGGPFNIQLSGGEPTLRDDLPEIIAMAHSLGFGFVQVNTNGLRLAHDKDYLRRLKAAGLDCVFLQFDGVTDEVYESIRGKALFQAKLLAIQRCREERLGVVLVPTLVPGVNTGQIGDIIRLAVENMPTVRAVHFQPVSYFGRFPVQPNDDDRITLPEVVRQIEFQTEGKIKASDLYPPTAENAYCSFQGKFTVQPNGEFKPVTRQPSACCLPASPMPVTLVQLGSSHPDGNGGSTRARQSVARQWAHPAATEPQSREPSLPSNVDSLDAFLRDREDRTLSISGMAFQDAWNLDLERLRDCFIHVVSPDNRLVPLCAYNLTDAMGHALHRASSSGQPGKESEHV